jgi:hypothetical protein
VQESYLKKGEIETRVYENMFRIYNARLARVEEELLFLEAKQFLKRKDIPSKAKLMRGIKK